MPKIQKLRKFKIASKSSPYTLPSDDLVAEEHKFSNTDDQEIGSELPKEKKTILSRGQRKRQEKRERVLTKLGVVPLKGMKTGNDQQTQNPVKQKPFQALLSELEASISESKEVIRPAASTMKTNRIKKSVAIRESQRMKLVEQHPNFIADPLQAMKSHIEQMIALKMENKSK